MAAKLLVHPTPVARRPDEVDNLEYLREFGSMVEATRLGVEDLEKRTGNLEGVSAYGNVAMSRNEWVVSARPKLLFNQLIGDPKGVSVLPDGGLELLLDGLWRLDCYVWAASTPYTGAAWVNVDVEIRRADGSIYQTRPFKEDVNDGSLGGGYSFVTDGPGWQVRVFAESGRWRRILGGTKYSYLSVNRWNPEKSNPGTPEVPDGPGAPT